MKIQINIIFKTRRRSIELRGSISTTLRRFPFRSVPWVETLHTTYKFHTVSCMFFYYQKWQKKTGQILKYHHFTSFAFLKLPLLKVILVLIVSKNNYSGKRPQTVCVSVHLREAKVNSHDICSRISACTDTR